MLSIGFQHKLLIMFILFVGGYALKMPELSSQVPAFPSAQGYGKFSTGGRGGEVYQVTNLDDSGAGSLREACMATGPRTIIFRVAGTIELSSSIRIISPYITIAGQTAPGDGICIRHAGNSGFGDALINVSTHDVIIRYIRLRRGPSMEGECCGDCLGLSHPTEDVYNVIIDHCSMSWSTDEITGTWYKSHNITFQSCILSEALYHSSHQDEGMPDGELEPHSMGPLLGDYSTEVTLYRNLMVHNADRNPYANSGHPGFIANFQVVNNVVYNWIYFGSKFGKNDGGLTKVNFSGNYLKAGPDTRTNRYEMLVQGTPQNTQVYVSGNIGHHRLTDDDPSTEWDIAGVDMTAPAPTDYRASIPFIQPEIPLLTASQAYDSVLTQAGASTRVDSAGKPAYNRDAVDERLILDVKNRGPFISRELGNGKSYYGLIDDPSQVGGWPDYLDGKEYPDEDQDGMSDEWEIMAGLDPGNPDDRNADRDGSGYTNLEEFLNMGDRGEFLPSITQASAESQWKCYPNPAFDYLIIEMAGTCPAGLIKVLDMNGRILISSNLGVISNSGLYLGTLPPGIYFLRLTDPANRTDQRKIFKY